MGILNRVGGLFGITESECESLCLTDITCVGAEWDPRGFVVMESCVRTRTSDFTPRNSSVLYEIVYRCPSM